jgi:hypothetical protein
MRDGLQPKRPIFSGHETFPFRYQWLPKAIKEASRNGCIFSDPDAVVTLGVGKNMVKSIRHWSLAAGILEEDPAGAKAGALRPTTIANSWLGAESAWDPYMEDPITAWWLHWRLTSTPERTPSTSWFVFHHAPSAEFTKDELLSWLKSWCGRVGWRTPSEGTLKRDIDVFLRTYVPQRPSKRVPIEDTLDCPLVDLGLIHALSSRSAYILNRSRTEGLPDELFAYALCDYLDRIEHKASTIRLESIALAPGSPGRSFLLSETGLIERLERLSAITSGAMVFDDTAGLRQVLIRDRIEPEVLIESYFKESLRVAPEAANA